MEKRKVFISWSGNLSKELAEILNKWLPCVIQNVEPFFSPEDIKKGTFWNAEINKALRECSIGIICLTNENMNEPWILFEAGALANRLNNQSRVLPVLFTLKQSDLSNGPLTTLQCTDFEKADFYKLLTSINTAGEKLLKDEILSNSFNLTWSHLEKQVQGKLAAHDEEKEKKQSRTLEDNIEDLLELSRTNARELSKLKTATNLFALTAQALTSCIKRAFDGNQNNSNAPQQGSLFGFDGDMEDEGLDRSRNELFEEDPGYIDEESKA